MTMFQQKETSRLVRPVPASHDPARVVTPSMWLWRAVIVIGWGLVVTSLVLLAWEVLQWFEEGTWRSISLAKMVHMPKLDHGQDQDWSSLDPLRAALRWFGRMPAVAMLFVGGLVCSWRANDLHTHAEAEAARSRPAAR